MRSPADGYTLLRQNSTMVTNLAMMDKLPYDPEKIWIAFASILLIPS
ncbi:hypothetical protein [Polaromonas jejuensis]|uniref:Uncharacterized protein n=1 Tax=Polaromonas jejuensis TaxID=457502 RepID=A0ABW0QF63_9BURK|nr:hypothetical protein [Polaromonas jejuensis]